MGPSLSSTPSAAFQHLGFQIYDVGLQSANSEAAKPMVFTITLLLICVAAAMNITTIFMRSRALRLSSPRVASNR